MLTSDTFAFVAALTFASLEGPRHILSRTRNPTQNPTRNPIQNPTQSRILDHILRRIRSPTKSLISRRNNRPPGLQFVPERHCS